MLILVALILGYLIALFLERRVSNKLRQDIKDLFGVNSKNIIRIANLLDAQERLIRKHDLAFQRYEGVRDAFAEHINNHTCRRVEVEEEWPELIQ